MPEKKKWWLIGPVLLLALLAGGGLRFWQLNKKQTVDDYLVKSEKSGEQVLLAEAVSWDGRSLVLKMRFSDKQKTGLEIKLNFKNVFILIPGNERRELPLLSRRQVEWETAFCQGDKLEIKVADWVGEQKLEELTKDDIKMIRNVGERKCR